MKRLLALALLAAGMAASQGAARADLVGYYTDNNTADTGPNAPIVANGFTAQQITDITTASLGGLNILMIDESDNSGISADLLARLPDIQTFVQAGGKLIVHDRFVSDGTAMPNPFLVGAPTALAMRDFTFSTDLNVVTPGTLVTNGPFGTIDDTTLDGGNSSSHGYVLAGTVPAGTVGILSNGTDPTHLAALSYGLGSGFVYYSTIPLDFYLDGQNPAAFSSIYAPNVLDYVHGLTPLSAVPEPSSLTMMAIAGAGGLLVAARRRLRRAR